MYSVQEPSILPFGSCLYSRLPSILISGSRITSTVQCTGTFNLALWNRTSSTGTFNLALWIQNCKNGYLQCCPPNLMLYISTGTFNLALRISNSTDGCLQSCLPNLKLEVWEPSILPPVSTIASRTTFNLALLVSNDKLDIMQPGLEAALLAWSPVLWMPKLHQHVFLIVYLKVWNWEKLNFNLCWWTVLDLTVWRSQTCSKRPFCPSEIYYIILSTTVGKQRNKTKTRSNTLLATKKKKTFSWSLIDWFFLSSV